MLGSQGEGLSPSDWCPCKRKRHGGHRRLRQGGHGEQAATASDFQPPELREGSFTCGLPQRTAHLPSAPEEKLDFR